MFSVDFIDDSGEIRATGFKEVVDTLYDKLQNGKIYLVKNGKLKPANPKFNQLKNDYELSLNEATEIVEDADTGDLPMQKVGIGGRGPDIESIWGGR